MVLSLGVEATLGLGNFAPKEDQGNILGSSFGWILNFHRDGGGSGEVTPKEKVQTQKP